jgi:hypothetical protein
MEKLPRASYTSGTVDIKEPAVAMTDPAISLRSFQEELLLGTILLSRTKLDPHLFIYRDDVGTAPRMSYARLEGRTVTAMAIFTPATPINGAPCMGIGYAVPETHRNQGRAKDIIKAAIADMQYGLRRQGHSAFYVEAIVGADNAASRRVAAQIISDSPEPMVDGISGLPAFRYLLKIDDSTNFAE